METDISADMWDLLKIAFTVQLFSFLLVILVNSIISDTGKT